MTRSKNKPRTEEQKIRNNEWTKEYALKMKEEDPEKYNRIRGREAQRRYREKNPARRLITSTKANAKYRGIEHSIKETDLSLPEYCPYLGIKIDYSAGNGKSLENPSVDRIDPTKGYTKDNVEVISLMANSMKSRADIRTLQNFALAILDRWPL